MARTKKKSKAVPVVTVLTLLIIAAAVVCFLIDPLVRAYFIAFDRCA